MSGITPQKVNYLRLSITDRCNLRCFYCAPAGEWEKLPAPEILRYEEMLHLARVAVAQGIRKIRVTGGEPLVRRGVVEFIQGLHQVPGLQEVCLTTNGVRLGELAPGLYAAGLRHLNLSLDTLRRERYQELTGSDHFLEVQSGLEKAASLGFHPIKINCVVLKDLNDDELLDFARLAQERPFQVRFIEFMPTVSRRKWNRHFLPMAEVRRRLAVLGEREPLTRKTCAGPARIFRFPGFRGELGFISAISEHQCPECNRLRLTAAGRLRPCLFGAAEIDIKGPLRQGADDAALGRLFREAVNLKAWKPEFTDPDTFHPCRQMVSIGG
ncbi:MAG: GTP 3',8-cyclase MoaA [Deltaproteobacteria bacterium]|nr:GTP 3',8-cyclase MoaA [Deltaproteobacteria bacterium]MBI4795583.1 GTP 3',8-cyclase MoaA [Deltaproteobacteria bacterium]